MCTPCAISNASADFTRMPLAAPRPVPTMMAVGVASPNAQGHEITNTEMAVSYTHLDVYKRQAVTRPRP